ATIAGVAAKKGLDRLLNIDDAQGKLKGLGNSTKQIATIMDSALASVKGTAFGLGDAATVASNAVAAGIKPGQDLTKYLTLTADAASIAGVSLDEMGSIINKTTTSGKVYTDNLNQLADRGIPIFQWLQKEYGVSADELSSMVQKGQVDSATGVSYEIGSGDLLEG
ncbi:tape measure protein, partial [Bacillus sp. S34]|nr:tape measure protein [Bacillus sp. S34]